MEIFACICTSTLYYEQYLLSIIFSIFYQVGGDINGKLDEGAASLMLDTKPSKVISDERTVSSNMSFLYFVVSASCKNSKFI